MKYIDADKLIAEIERLMQECRNIRCFSAIDSTYKEGRLLGYEDIKYFINSLSEEQPSEDLEKAAEGYEHNLGYYECMNQWPGIAFKAGAQWQKEQMMKDAVDGFIFQSAEYYPKELIATYNGNLKIGDKVKIIIVKED